MSVQPASKRSAEKFELPHLLGEGQKKQARYKDEDIAHAQVDVQ
jgi:hypothetical protein